MFLLDFSNDPFPEDDGFGMGVVDTENFDSMSNPKLGILVSFLAKFPARLLNKNQSHKCLHIS